MDFNLTDYIEQHSSAETDVLQQINRRTHVYTINPRMLSGHIQGRVLSMLSQMIRPKRILEMGTFAGYSALCLAEGLSPDGHLITIEKNDEMEDFIRENLSLSPLGKKIELRIGNVLDVIEQLRQNDNDSIQDKNLFDLVFMDADKKEYLADLQAVLPLVRPGGWILADNTLWDGHITDPTYDKDKQTIGLRLFNDFVRDCPFLEKVILPIRDGLTIIRKVE